MHGSSNKPIEVIRQSSEQLAERGRRVFPQGITRATVDRSPSLYYVDYGRGAHITDVDGRRLLDLNNNFTTLIHGHAFEPVVDAVTRVLRDGTCFSNPTQYEIPLAELLCERIPAAEQIRFVNTGTEAVMFAIKAARAATGRPAIAKIEGAYHGAYDWAEVGQVGEPMTWGDPDEPTAVAAYHGQPVTVSKDVVILRFNDIEGARRRIAAHADRIACILLDPMPSRAGLMAPDPDFVAAVMQTAQHHGILVIADEVLNLRQGYHGASVRFGIEPDLIAMGKIIGGGFPVGAVGGRASVMQVFGGPQSPARLSQGGTFSANPVSMVAGFACMSAMIPQQFDHLERLGNRVRVGLDAAIRRHGARFCVTGSASLFRIHPRQETPREYRDTYLSAADAAVMGQLDLYFKDNGVLLPKGAAACLSTPMTDADADLIVQVFDQFLTSGAF